MDLPPLPPPPDMDAAPEGEPDGDEPMSGGTRDALIEALEMIGDADFLSALDDATKIAIVIDVDSGDIAFTAGDASLSIPGHLLAKRDE